MTRAFSRVRALLAASSDLADDELELAVHTMVEASRLDIVEALGDALSELVGAVAVSNDALAVAAVDQLLERLGATTVTTTGLLRFRLQAAGKEARHKSYLRRRRAMGTAELIAEIEKDIGATPGGFEQLSELARAYLLMSYRDERRARPAPFPATEGE